jgi:hypothetical protein
MASGADRAHDHQVPTRRASFRTAGLVLALLVAALLGWCAAAVHDYSTTPFFEPTDTNATRLGMLVNDSLLDTIPEDAEHVGDDVEVGDDGDGWWPTGSRRSSLSRRIRYPEGLDADDVRQLAQQAADAGWTIGEVTCDRDHDTWNFRGSKQRGPIPLSLYLSTSSLSDDVHIALSAEATVEQPGSPDPPVPAVGRDGGAPLAGTCLDGPAVGSGG